MHASLPDVGLGSSARLRPRLPLPLGQAHRAHGQTSDELLSLVGARGIAASRPGLLTEGHVAAGTHVFVAQEMPLEFVSSLREIVVLVKKRDRPLAEQIEQAATSASLDLCERRERVAEDQLHHYRGAPRRCARRCASRPPGATSTRSRPAPPAYSSDARASCSPVSFIGHVDHRTGASRHPACGRLYYCASTLVQMKTQRANAKAAATERELYRAVMTLSSCDELRAFFRDLCTPAEVQALADRWAVVKLLQRDLSYREIHARTGVSLTTIGRVARSFTSGEGGYATAATRLEEARHG